MRQNWLNSLKKGDTVWKIPEYLFIDCREDVKFAVCKETFDGWFSFNPQRKSAILKCEFDGGFEVETNRIFQTREQAQKAIAPKVVKALKTLANEAKKDLKILDKQTKKWQILTDDF